MNSKLIFFIALVLNFTVAFANNPDKVLGVWVTQDSDSKVEIFKKDNKYYGKIVWLKTPMDNNKPVVDKFNPKEKLKTRPVLGLVVLNDLNTTITNGKTERFTIQKQEKHTIVKCGLMKKTIQLYILRVLLVSR